MKKFKVQVLKTLLTCIVLLPLTLNAQFDPNHSNTSSCPPNACTPGCGPGGPGGPDCTGLTCPPDPECDSNTQSCVDPDPNPDPPSCEGSDCGDNQCNGSSNAAAGGSGALDTSTQNPINLISGNKYKRQEDLSPLPGVLGLEFVRHYNSLLPGNIGLGGGWRHSYATVLQVHKGFKPGETDFIKLQQSDGRIIRFRRVGERKQGAQYATRNYADGFIATTEYGYQWHWRSGRIASFDDRGLLVQLKQGKKELSLTYSGSGQLLSVTDPQGRRLSLAYSRGMLARVTDPEQRVTKYRYSQEKQLVKVIRPNGDERHYHYQDETRGWNLTGITDERGIRVENYGYDEQGRATVSSKGLNTEKVSIVYEDGQRVVTNGLGESTVYLLGDVNGQKVISEVRGPGCSACSGGDIAYEYNDNLQVTKVTYKNGSTVEYDYDERGRTISQYRQQLNQARQLVAAYEYAGTGNRPSVIKRPSIAAGKFHRTQMSYAADGQLLKVVERGYAPSTPLNDESYEEGSLSYVEISRSSEMEYDSKGQLVRIDGPRSDVADELRLEYDARGYLSTLLLPSGQVQRVLSYDESGRPTQLQQSGQTPTTIEYNNYGKPQTVTKGLRSVRYEYNELGKLVGVIDPDGHKKSIIYDSANRLTRISQDNGPSVEVAFDDESRITQRQHSDANGNIIDTVGYVYDAQNRIESISKDHGESSIRYGYNEQGELTQLIDQDNRVTRLGLSAIGSLLQIRQPDDAVTLLHLDQQGNTVGLTDANSNTTVEIKDDFGQVVKLLSADKGDSYFQYDAAGNMLNKQTAGGVIVTRVYDAGNRLTRQITPDGQTVFEYEPLNGRLAKITNPQAADVFTYDSEARLLSHTRKIDQHQFTTNYEYNALNRIAKKTLPDGQILRYHYYSDGKQKGDLRAITRDDWFGASQTELLTELDNNQWDGQTKINFGNGLATTYGYDSKGKLTRVDTDRQLPILYEYDQQGNIVGMNVEGALNSYAYDENNRLISADLSGFSYSYVYDKVGNRLESSKNQKIQRLAYKGRGNRLTQINDDDVTYNAEGSPVIQPSAMGERRYEYNAEQRPIRLYVNDQLTAEYAYNGFGERVKKTVYSQKENKQHSDTTYYLYDGNALSAEVNGKGELTSQYIYYSRMPVVKLEGREPYFIHADHIGAPRLVTDENQNSVWESEYTPFGNAKIKRDDITLNLRFPGQYQDDESGTYYNYYRDYDPAVGRYQTSDPLGIEGGINSYAYAFGNPIKNYDVLGLKPEAEPLPQGGFMITAEQYQELTELAEANRRPEYYMRLYELTEYSLFSDMAQISSNSGFLGGVAWRANDIIAQDYSDIYPGDESMTTDERISVFSNIIFLHDFRQITHILCSLDGEPIYGIPSELEMARAAYDGWLEVDPGFATIAPPLARYAQQLAVEGNVGGLIDLYVSVAGPIPAAILALGPTIITQWIMTELATLPASGILAQSVTEETAAIAGDVLPVIDDHRRGFYRDSFIEDHGGMQNVTITQSADGRFSILSADSSLVTDPDRRRAYEGVNSHPTRDVIVIPN